MGQVKDLILVAVRERNEPTVRDVIARDFIPAGRAHVIIHTEHTDTKLTTRDREETSKRLVHEFSTLERGRIQSVFIDRELPIDSNTLRRWASADRQNEIKVRQCSINTILQELNDFGQTNRFHWKSYSAHQVQHFSGETTNVEHWVNQFRTLKCTALGKTLCMHLSVILIHELAKKPFLARRADCIGQRQIFCFVKDNDAGGSWVSIQDTLTHLHVADSVHPVVWDNAKSTMTFPHVAADEIILCEDGLWSGMEAVRRLQAIKEHLPDCVVKLRFAIVTDFGLRVARFAIRKLRLVGRVEIDAAFSDIVNFLSDNTPDVLENEQSISIDQYYQNLHAYLLPVSRRLSGLSEDDVVLCKKIGLQLVRNWLEKENPEKSDSTKIEKFALGGGGFGSTVLFSRSVPKVCLPLLWLDGPVEIDGIKLTWRPLFIDSRRITDRNLLNLL